MIEMKFVMKGGDQIYLAEIDSSCAGFEFLITLFIQKKIFCN